MRIYFSPDGDGGTGAENITAPEATPAPETQPEAEPVYERPKYYAQINPQKADSDDYKALYKYQKIDDLADAYIAQSKEMDDLRKKSERSIYVPEVNDVEGIKAFKSKLGVPETAEGYSLSTLKESKLDDATKKMIRETAYGAMLSDKQAEAIGVALLKTAKMAAQGIKAQRETAIKTFDTTLAASYGDIASETDRKSSAERDKATYNKFAVETGMKDYFDNRGLSYDPAFVKAMAAYARKHSGVAPQSNLPNTRPSASRGTETPMSERAAAFYGKGFNEAFKKH